jgi:GNAT superfamily N-acetyltransferase
VNDLDRIELDAAADFWAAAPAATKAALAIDAGEAGGARCFWCSDLQPTLMFRRALWAMPPDAAAIDAVVAHMGRRGGAWAVGCAASAADGAMASELASRGFEPAYAWMKFRRDTREPRPAPTDLAVREVGADEAAAFGAVVAAAYGLPPAARAWLQALPGRARWGCMVAFDGHRAVGAAAVFVEGDHAWFGFAATLPEARRRGAQGALLARRVEAATARGARVLVTETGERLAGRPSDSYRNIERAGFAEAGLRRHWLAPG